MKMMTAQTEIDLDSALKSIRRLMKLRSMWSGRVVLVAEFTVIVILPVLEAYLGSEDNVKWYIWLTVIVFHIVLGAFAFMGSLNLHQVSTLIDLDAIDGALNRAKLNEQKGNDELHNLQEELKNVTLSKDQQIKQLRYHQISVEASLSHLQYFLACPEKISAKQVGQLLSPLIENKTDVLEYRPDDLYNFALYLYNRENDILELFWRDCDEKRLSRRDRSWKPGVGHAGIAFQKNNILITPDVELAEDLANLLSFDDADRDKKYYRSFMSIAIGDSRDSKRAVGVLTITSDRSGHFEKNKYEKFCLIYRLILSIYLGSCASVEARDG